MAQCPDLVSRPLTYLPTGLTDHISELFVLDSHTTTTHSQARMVFDITRSIRGSLTMPINHSRTRLKAAGCGRRRAQPPQGVATPTSAERQATPTPTQRQITKHPRTHQYSQWPVILDFRDMLQDEQVRSRWANFLNRPVNRRGSCSASS